MKRVFLGRAEPLVESAGRWLIEELGQELSSVLVVVPGRRGGRLLLEKIALRCDLVAAGELCLNGFEPPRIVPVGTFPELLYRPPLALASDLERLLVWLEVLQAESPERLRRLAPGPLQAQDLNACWVVAEELLALQDELALEGLRFGAVPARASGVLEGFGEARWRLLAELEEKVASGLAARRLGDRNVVRLQSLDGDTWQAGGRIVLVSILDLGRVPAQMLRQCGRAVTLLLAAPEEESDLFDGLGRPRVGAWRDRRLSLSGVSLRVVDRPRDQAAEVAWQLSQERSRQGSGRPTTVGVGDPDVIPLLERCLEASGIPFHAAAARRLSDTGPFRLLRLLGRYYRRRRLADLAALLRCPEIEAYLTREAYLAREAALAPEAALGSRDWLTFLDAYSSETLLRHVQEELPGDPAAAKVVRVLDRHLQELAESSLGSMAESDSWRQGSSRVLGLLRRLYEDRVFDRTDPEDAATYAGLEALFEALTEQVGCSRPARSSPQGDLLDFIELTIRRLSKLRIPSGTAGANVEIVGWLDLALDDAPDVVVTGLNEGTIPQSVSADGLMSEPLRRVLGLVDGDRRYVRDLVLLSALVESRRLTLIAGRRSRDEEPLVPSRLVLACDPSLLAATVLEFYGPAQRPHRADSTASGESSGFTFVAPGRSEGTIQRLSVTAFRDYLSCPYRFYLKHVLRLRESRDLPIEMRPIDFGSLAHEILRRFASTDASSSPEDRTVFEALERLLNRVVAERFGSRPVVAVRIQVEQLRRRLRSFASWQAAQVRCGWVVDQTFAERSLTATITVDEGRLLISGRVDRLDRHPDLGIRVLDYKTGERPSLPDRAHCEKRGGELRWRDLQLPLYHFLVREDGEEEDVSLGFVNLARDPRGELLATADWSQETIQEAMTAVRAVVRDVLLQRFWPPAGAPDFDDGLSGLAGDRWLEREAMIQAAPPSFE